MKTLPQQRLSVAAQSAGYMIHTAQGAKPPQPPHAPNPPWAAALKGNTAAKKATKKIDLLLIISSLPKFTVWKLV
jgi:hypothetical protein